MDGVVRVDAELLNEIEELISKRGNSFRYVNKKQFVNVAILDLLSKERGKDYKYVEIKLKKEKKRKNK